MAESENRSVGENPRVGVYIDFDNVVLSRRDQAARTRVDPVVDLDAIFDFAASFGTVMTSRAYADWSHPDNVKYRGQLQRRAVDTTQLFINAGRNKNAADIRLAVDVVEDLFRLDEITHVVIVSGDSDFVPLAQRIKRLGRYVVGIGIAGSTSPVLAAACDEYHDYDNLPGLHTQGDDDAPAVLEGGRGRTGAVRTPTAAAISIDRGAASDDRDVASDTAADTAEAAADEPAVVSRQRATQLLLRALEYGTARSESDWQAAGSVKSQMLRMEPGFQESALGFGSFSDFVRSRQNLVEFDDKTQGHRIRLRDSSKSRARR